jgi:hypothetical protein
VQWSDSSRELATWEDKYALHQAFPHAPAWGQAGFKGNGIVSDTALPATKEDLTTEDDGPSGPQNRPRRE